METWIEKMNEMFKANCYTDHGRVTVDYCKNANKIMISVLDDVLFIDELDSLTDFGLMMACMNAVDMLYNK